MPRGPLEPIFIDSEGSVGFGGIPPQGVNVLVFNESTAEDARFRVDSAEGSGNRSAFVEIRRRNRTVTTTGAAALRFMDAEGSTEWRVGVFPNGVAGENFDIQYSADGAAWLANPAMRVAVAGTITFGFAVTFSGQILASSGTAAAPGYAFSADPDVGIYRIAANRLGFATNGAANWEINAAGDLLCAIAATQIVPGATSLALRNNANNATNVTVANAGAVTVGRGLLTALVGVSARLPSATAAGAADVNPEDATALNIASAGANAYTGTAARLRLPGITSNALGGDTGTFTLLGLGLSQAAITNPAMANALPVNVTQIAITGAAGQLNITGAYAWTGVAITTPAQVANGAANAAMGIVITGGAQAGGAGAEQVGMQVTMADAAHVAFRAMVGVSRFAAGVVGVPGIAFSADIDTGLYSSGANILDIATAGVRAAFVSAAQLLTGLGGVSVLLPSRTADSTEINAEDATALNITPAIGATYTGAAARMRLPGVLAGVAGDVGAIVLTGLGISQGALGNPGAGIARPITVTQIAVTGAAGQANVTGIYTWSGLTITTPNHGNAIANHVGVGIAVTTGTVNGAGGATNLQTGITITGGVQTAGLQRGLYINMAAATHRAIHVDQGISQFDDHVRVAAAHFLDTSGAVIFNEAAADIDFRVESQTNANAILVDAALNAVGILSPMLASVVLAIGGSRTAGAGESVNGLYLSQTLTTVDTGSGYLFTVDGTLVEAGAGNHPIFASARFLPPTITGGLATLDDAATVYITAAPTGTVVNGNWALWVDAGESRFDGLITGRAGVSSRLPSATAAGAADINPENATALNIASSGASAYTGTSARVRLPGITSADGGGHTGTFTLLGLGLSQGAITNPLAGNALVVNVTQVAITGAAGQLNITGAYTWTGVAITTPAQAATVGVNVGTGISITGGAMAGGAGSSQRGLYVNMAATTDVGIRVDQGRTILDGDMFVRGGNAPVIAKTFATDATAGDIVYTAAQVYGGVMLRDPNGLARADTLPTAALIVAAVPNAAVGDTLEFLLVNTADAAEIITVGAGAGNTLIPASVTPTQNEQTRFIIRLTNVGGGTEATTIYAMTAGA